ncbi:MAG: hypothetical protein ACR2OU_13305 [Thermomicrobiales bacterium]
MVKRQVMDYLNRMLEQWDSQAIPELHAAVSERIPRDKMNWNVFRVDSDIGVRLPASVDAGEVMGKIAGALKIRELEADRLEVPHDGDLYELLRHGEIIIQVGPLRT